VKITDAIHEFILYKQSLGMTYKNRALKLTAFARLAGPVEIDGISPETVRRFLDAGRPVTAEWFNKFSSLKMFFRFALSRGYATRNPLPVSQPKNPRQFRPYLYSMEEVQKMIRVVDNRHRGNWHLEPYTIRTLILLLYGTGLRIGEAIRLQHRDVDLNDAILTVRETKFYKTRLVPVSSDLTGALRSYFERKWNGRGFPPTTPFLATYDGRPVTHLSAELAFKRIRYEAGVKRTDASINSHVFMTSPYLRRQKACDLVSRRKERPASSSAPGDLSGPRKPSGNVALSDDDQGTHGRSEPSLQTLRVPRRQAMKNDSLLGPWIRRFLLEHLVAERNLSRNTQRSYRDTLCLLLPRLAL